MIVNILFGKNTIRKINWSGVPPTSKSLAIIIDDQNGLIHNIVFNIPSNISSLDCLPNGNIILLPESAIVAKNTDSGIGKIQQYNVNLIAMPTNLSASLANKPNELLKEIWNHKIDIAVHKQSFPR